MTSSLGCRLLVPLTRRSGVKSEDVKPGIRANRGKTPGTGNNCSQIRGKVQCKNPYEAQICTKASAEVFENIAAFRQDFTGATRRVLTLGSNEIHHSFTCCTDGALRSTAGPQLLTAPSSAHSSDPSGPGEPELVFGTGKVPRTFDNKVSLMVK